VVKIVVQIRRKIRENQDAQMISASIHKKTRRKRARNLFTRK